jgi:hypothetical protein
VLFSSDPVAKVINEHFEPVWVSVREVPVVTIDFGGGHKITRTLNGNVATYALHPDGTVLDILPGIYQPDEYVKQLTQLNYLHQYAYGSLPAGKQGDKLIAYHTTQAKLLADGQEPGRFEFNFAAAISKAKIENPLKFVVAGKPMAPAVYTQPNGNTTSPAQIAVQQFRATEPKPASKAAETLRGWKELAEDTKLNETAHRRMIHEHLAKAGTVRPKDVTRWLYKEVLHADLDDPYLGLGEVLNKNYPFADEDRPAVVRP